MKRDKKLRFQINRIIHRNKGRNIPKYWMKNIHLVLCLIITIITNTELQKLKVPATWKSVKRYTQVHLILFNRHVSESYKLYLILCVYYIDI